MPDQAGFELYKTFYSWPERFRLGDPVLVREVTGMEWPEFANALENVDPSEPPDQVVLVGLIAVGFWQGNPTMSRANVRRAIERTYLEDLEIVEGEGDASPPPLIPDELGASLRTTSSDSSDPLDSSSDETNLNDSGLPGSPNSRPESARA